VNVKGGGRIKSREYRAWQNAEHWKIITDHPRPRLIQPPYAVRISAPIQMRGDLDNIIKPLLDLMQKAGVITNDASVIEILARKNLVTPGHCVVTVQTCGEFI